VRIFCHNRARQRRKLGKFLEKWQGSGARFFGVAKIDQISVIRSQISDLRSQISDLRSQISDLRSQISEITAPCCSFVSHGRCWVEAKHACDIIASLWVCPFSHRCFLFAANLDALKVWRHKRATSRWRWTPSGAIGMQCARLRLHFIPSSTITLAIRVRFSVDFVRISHSRMMLLSCCWLEVIMRVI
jgi:hypothetical protein